MAIKKEAYNSFNWALKWEKDSNEKESGDELAFSAQLATCEMESKLFHPTIRQCTINSKSNPNLLGFGGGIIPNIPINWPHLFQY